MIQFEIIYLLLYAAPELDHRHIHPLPLLEETEPLHHASTVQHQGMEFFPDQRRGKVKDLR